MQYRIHLLIVGISAAGLALTGCSNRSENERQNAETSGQSAEPVPTAESEPFETREGFRLLGLNDFKIFHGKEPTEEPTWTAEGDVIKCTGQPRGYIFTKQAFDDFTLRLDYRYVPADDQTDEKQLEASNTGILVFISGEHKLWPVSLEVQGKHIEMGQIKANGGAAAIEIDDDDQARTDARKPVGEWNSVEVVSTKGALTASLNGTQVCKSDAGELVEGSIGLQSEGFEVQFRNVRIRKQLP